MKKSHKMLPFLSYLIYVFLQPKTARWVVEISQNSVLQVKKTA